MIEFLLIVFICGGIGTWECIRLKKDGRRLEIVPYVVFCSAGIVLFGMYTLWKDIPSVLDIMKTTLSFLGG